MAPEEQNIDHERNLRAVAENALDESEGIFRLLVDAVTDYAIFALDTQGRVLTWNAGARRIKGYQAKEIIGQHFSRFYPKADVDNGKPVMELRVAAEEGRFEDEGWRVRKDGSLFWANVVISALRDKKGVLRGFAKVTRDLTPRKQTEEALRESEERYRLLVDSVKDYAIIFLDTQGKITSWNRGAQAIKGYTAQEIVGSHFSKFYPKEDVAAGKPEMELRVATATGRFEDFGWRVKKDGSRFWANVVISAVRDGAGILRGFSKVTRDLTERKKVEDELKQSEEQLRAANQTLDLKVEERTVELSRATARLELAVQSRDSFLSIASHELKTPLTSFKLRAQMRARALEKKNFAAFTPEKLIQMAQEDARQIDRLTRLVDDMLDITRISVGKLSLERQENTDLSALVRDVVERSALQLQEAGCEVTVHCPEKVLGFWDPFRIEQVFVNLLTNAMKYASEKPIDIDIGSGDGVARLTVRDHGIGIAPADQQRVFQQFERAKAAGGVSGLGLGLFIVEQIVEAHGGQIRLESELGHGSAFIVELPVDLRSSEPAPSKKQAPPR